MLQVSVLNRVVLVTPVLPETPVLPMAPVLFEAPVFPVQVPVTLVAPAAFSVIAATLVLSLEAPVTSPEAPEAPAAATAAPEAPAQSPVAAPTAPCDS